MVKPSIYASSALILVSLLLPACSTPTSGTTVSVQMQNGTTSVGTVTLIDKGEATQYQVELAGLVPNESYRVTLHTGSCDTPSASFAQLSEINVDAEGNGHAEGSLLYRGQENIAFSSITDGEHMIILQSGDSEGCAVIPAIAPTAPF